MQDNLVKFKQLQKEREQHQQKQLLESNIMNLIVSEAKVEQQPKEVMSKEIQIAYDISFTATYEKCEQEMMMKQKKEWSETIRNISKYNNFLFVQYLGLSVEQEKVQLKKQQDKKENKKESDKKAQVKKQTKPQANKLPEKSPDKNENSSIVVQPKIKLQALTQSKLQKLDMSRYKKQIKSKGEFIERFNLGLQIIQAVASLNELEYTFFPLILQDLISLKQGHLKLAIHSTKLWRTVTEQQILQIKQKQSVKFKKQAMINPSLKYTSPEFIIKSINIKDMRLNDIWKTGVLFLALLIGEDLTKDLLALQSVDQSKIKEHKLIDEAKISKVKKYLRQEDITQILKMVSMMPSQRPQLKTYRQLLKRISQQLNQFLDDQTLEMGKDQYQKQKAERRFKFLPQLKANEQILTLDHRKKLVQYFKINQSRSARDFKLLYRASQTQFSSKAFYEVVYEKKNILVVICQKPNNKKIICYSEQVFDLAKCNGIFGGFIKDSKKLSFIYSPQENQFCKLKNADKAIGVSFSQGPIFGDGDLVISDGGIHNICKFPVSYESVKLKKLIKAQRFQISEYDVYQVLF